MRIVPRILTLILLPLSLWAATVRGQVRLPGAGPFTGVAGVKVVLTSGNSVAPHIDSAVSDSIGNYVRNHGATAGARTVITTKSGYTGSVNLVNVPTAAGDTGTLIFNPVISVNNKTSHFTGIVKRASDSSIIIGAIVTLTGGPDPAVNLSDTTDSTGAYRFDSISTGGVYTVTVNATNYSVSSVGSLNVGWNSTFTVPIFYLTQNLGTLTGIVASSAAGNPVIVGAKVVVSVGATKVDSTVTNASGQYTLTLNAAVYTVVVSAAGFKDSLGNASRTLTASVTFNTPTNLNTTLSPATSTISGTVRSANATTGPPIHNAKVVLQRRFGTTAAGVWYTLDSTFTDANGIFIFDSLIASSGGNTATSTNYRLVASAMYYITGTSANITVALGATNTTNMALNIPDAITPFHVNNTQSIRFSTLGENLVLNLKPFDVRRTIEVFDLSGQLQQQIDVRPGESQAVLPARYAPEKGFLFLVK